MNYFLVDYENVNISGLEGISELSESDVVIIFYSENAETLTFSMHEKINKSKAEIKFQKVAVQEKNALDFQLCFYLGWLIRDTFNDEDNYFIAAKDNDYAFLLNYCKNFGVNLKIVSNLQAEEKNIQPTVEPTELEIKLSKMLTSKTDIDEAIKIIKNSANKIELNNNLGKKFQSQKGGEIYRAAKSFIGKI